MKNYKCRALVVCVLGFACGEMILRAADVTGTGYIYLTQPTTAWSPPSSLTDTPRFIWYPDKAAFRFGDLSNSPAAWSSASVGQYSFAGGLDTTASGFASIAYGVNSTAAGDLSIALGADSYAYGVASLSIGSDGAYGDYSFAFGTSYSNGDYSIALVNSEADGLYSGAILGGFSAGDFSFSIWGIANADGSLAIGRSTLVNSQSGVALGSSNKTKRRNGAEPNPAVLQADDPLLMVGNASPEVADSLRSNALTVYRDGQAHFAGAVRVPESGDLPMGTFTAKPSGVVFP